MKDSKKLLIVMLVNLFFLALTIVTDVLYLNYSNPYIFKTLASLTFVLCGLANALLVFILKLNTNRKFLIFMIIGQLFAFSGDILLIDNFIVGAILFAIGHVFFFISYLMLAKFKWTDSFYIIGTIAISLIIIFSANLDFNGMQMLIVIYAIIISAMLGKSASVIKENVPVGLCVFIGSLMFFLSDMFLMFSIFGNMGRTGDVLCLIFYYPAEFVLAVSISIIGLLKQKQIDNKKDA